MKILIEVPDGTKKILVKSYLSGNMLSMSDEKEVSIQSLMVEPFEEYKKGKKK